MRLSMILAAALTSLGLFGVAASGCSPSADEACQNFDASYCAETQKCAPFFTEIMYGGAQACESRLKDKCLGSLEVAGSKATPDDIESCANAYSELSCDDLLAGVRPKQCDVRGEKDDGAVCAAAVQCKSGVCQDGGEGNCGTCVTPIPEGGACAGSTKPCTAGMYCAGDGACRPFGLTGATCDDKTDVRCLVNHWCKAGVCTPKLTEVDAACTDTNECDILSGVYCSPDTKKCVAIGIAKVGAACGANATTNTYSACEADAYCDASPTGTCKSKIAVGNSCTIDPDTKVSNCVSGAQCIGGTCSTSFPVCN